MPQVSIITVCMNRPDILYPCLDSIRLHTSVSYETLVVAYRFSPANLQDLRTRYPWVTVIESNEVRGFSENNNLALVQATGEYCFIVNDDTILNMPVIDMLVADFGRLPAGAAAISPKIVFADGTVQTCGRAPWTMCRYMLHYLHLVDEKRPTRWSMKEGLFRTWTLNGACFLVRTSAFREAGWFDARYFFTPEDIALGHALNDSGYTVWTDADAVITHLAGTSVSPMEYAIKPTRVAGALIFYSGGSRFRRLVLGGFIRLVEGLRMVRHSITGHTSGHGKMMYDTARNVRWAVLSGKSPKEVFRSLTGI